MTEFAPRDQLARIATVRPEIARCETDAAHPFVRQEIDRSFELPTSLYVATVAAYLGFLGVMAAAFMNPGLAIPMVIFALFVIAAFGTPTLWTRMQPLNGQRAMRFDSFMNRGIQTATGPLSGGAALVQVLILPALILFWGICVAVIAAFV